MTSPRRNWRPGRPPVTLGPVEEPVRGPISSPPAATLVPGPPVLRSGLPCSPPRLGAPTASRQVTFLHRTPTGPRRRWNLGWRAGPGRSSQALATLEPSTAAGLPPATRPETSLNTVDPRGSSLTLPLEKNPHPLKESAERVANSKRVEGGADGKPLKGRTRTPPVLPSLPSLVDILLTNITSPELPRTVWGTGLRRPCPDSSPTTLGPVPVDRLSLNSGGAFFHHPPKLSLAQ